MAVEKKPAHPLPLGHVPPGTSPYKVSDTDSWVNIALRLQMDAWDLIYLNFKTRDPDEVNWYLRHHVGCRRQTADGDNWMFSSDANPGVIHVPIRRITMPPMVIEGKAPSKLRKVWAGLGKSHSGDFFVIGAHDMTGKIYNLGDDASNVRNAWININGYKFGPGLGGSVSAVFVIAHGYDHASGMDGVAGGWDFDVALFSKLSDFLKGVKGLGKSIDTIEKYKKMRYLTENAIKNAGINKPGVYTLPIPFAGGGVHLWAGYKFGDVTVVSAGLGVP